MKKSLFALITLGAFTAAGYAETIVFSDNFSVSQGSSFVTSGAIGTTAWSITRSGVDWGGRIDNGILELTNDASVEANANGWVFASRSLSSTGAFNTILANSAGLVSWTLNMRQIRTDPAGFSAGSYGVAYILAGNGTIAQNSGEGWALVLGQSGALDPIRLAHFSGGLGGTLTNVITASAPLSDIGAEYLSLQVTYDPETNLWSLLGRNDGPSSFTDPLTGTLSSLGSATNATLVNTSLPVTGAYWQGSTAANQTAFFDNISLTAVPEPAVGLFLLGIGMYAVRRRFTARG